MPYMTIRVFAANKDVDIDSVRDAVRNGLVPQLQKLSGFQRYVAFLCKDGRYGSTSVFDSRQAAEQASELARDYMRDVPAHKNNRLETDLRGEVGLSFTGSTPLTAPTIHGVMRLYRTDASFAEVNDAIESEGGEVIRGLPGLARYTTVKCEDGRVAIVSSFDTEEHARALTAKAREMRQKPGSRLAKALPNDPEVIEAKALFAVVNA